ncbi:hypothetical protein IHE55_13080 [Streptomyces pactum]|uniref:Transposase n=1 Tax=Streptomyces pactum TaxID=68249 RepID=A0ABS0NKF6_9ACTN|nr:hypothetical protein [Streptomyces pactum]MBH5335678.1 hypothetical protein [Streptomyces pactum]
MPTTAARVRRADVLAIRVVMCFLIKDYLSDWRQNMNSSRQPAGTSPPW